MNRLAIIVPFAILLLLATAWWWTASPDLGGNTEDQEPARAETSAAAAISSSETAPATIPQPGQSQESVYTEGPQTRDGTGRYYMGREIARVMGHQAIGWLERRNREDEEAPSIAIEALDLEPSDTIADIGAGSGYYSFRIAPLVPEGKVVAVDIQPEMVAFLEEKEAQLGFTNVEAHLGAIDDARLPPESIDAALMVDAYHEFSHPREMMQSLFLALRPGGRIILLEYRAEDPSVPIKPLHKMSEAQARSEMAAVGLHWQATHDFLPWQHFMIFTKP